MRNSFVVERDFRVEIEDLEVLCTHTRMCHDGLGRGRRQGCIFEELDIDGKNLSPEIGPLAHHSKTV